MSSIAASPTPDLAARELRRLFDERPRFEAQSLGTSPGRASLTAEEVVRVTAEVVRLLRSEEKKPLVHHITVSRELFDGCVPPRRQHTNKIS